MHHANLFGGSLIDINVLKILMKCMAPASALPPFKIMESRVCARGEGHVVWSKALICSGVLNLPMKGRQP
jgi:hypothetical protein